VRKYVPISVIAVVLSVAPSANCAAVSADQPTGIDVIHGYAGDWEISIERLDTPHSKAGTEKSSLHNDCWKSGAYFACNQYVNGESKVLLVFTFDGQKNIYTSYQIPQDGSDAGSGKLVIEANVWTFPWHVEEGGKTTWFRVVNVWTAPDRIEYRQEFSEDNAHWTVMAKGTEHRVHGK
jgi:hypothetical protein